MGLFDIFRRRKNKPAEADASEQPQAASTADQAATTSQATDDVDQAQSRASSDQKTTPEAPTQATTTNQAAPAATDHDQPGRSSAVTAPQPTAASADSLAAPASPEATDELPDQHPRVSSDTPAGAVKTTNVDPEATTTEPAPAASDAPVKQQDQAQEPVEPTTPAGPQVATAEASAAGKPTETADSAATEQGTAAATSAKYDQGLAKSRTGFGARLNRFLANFRRVDEDFFEDLEDLLIESDVGYEMAMKLTDALREEVKLQNAHSKQDVSNVIIEKMVELYDAAGAGEDSRLHFAKTGPTVFMFVGVNGAGKTTTIGKLAARFKAEGRRVLLAAADTFRAGATEQLAVWAQRDGVDIVTGPEQGDPAAVVFDAVTRAKRDHYDVLLVDTAGRLQNKVNLMNELAKMKRILTREIPEAPHEVLLVLDATTGQNALNQAKLFKETTAVTGIVLTKLDGTARGIVLAIQEELHLPVKFVGLGEQVGDLAVFNAEDFVYGLFKGLVTVN